jgi:hypothetical protein
MTFALKKTKLVQRDDLRDFGRGFPLWEKGLIFLFARGICASVSSLLNALSLAQRGIVLSVGYFSTWTRRARGRNAFAYLSLVTFCNSTRLYWFSFAHQISLPFSQKKTAVAKNVQNQENLGQKAKAKPPDPAMDSHEDREHHSLQRQETTLEKNQVEHLIHYYYI